MSILGIFRLCWPAIFSLLIFAPAADAQWGDLDPTFDIGSGVDGVVESVAVQADGKVLLAGNFGRFNDIPRAGIVRLNENGSLDPTFDPGTGVTGTIHRILVLGSGKIIIAGQFSAYNGSAAGNIARLGSDGSFDSTFAVGTGADGPIFGIAAGYAGAIYLGGDFQTINGQPRTRVAKLGATGALDTVFKPAANGVVYTVATGPASNDMVYIGGGFTSFGGNSNLRRLARASQLTGNVDSGFRMNIENGAVHAIVPLEPHGFSSVFADCLIGGDFTRVDGVQVSNIILTNNRADLQDLNVYPNGVIRSLAVDDDAESFFMCGGFTYVNGRPAGGVARVERVEGFPVDSWIPDAGFATAGGAGDDVRAMAADANGRMVIGGGFTSVSSTPRNGAARLLAEFGFDLPGTVAASEAFGVSASTVLLEWNAAPGTVSYQIERCPDGVDTWEQVGVTSGLTHTDTGLPASTTFRYRVRAWNPNGHGAYGTVVSATTRNPWSGAGTPHPSVAGLAGASSTVFDSVAQPDGKILICGSFTTVHGQTRRRVARLNPDWTPDPGFDAGDLANGAVTNIALAPDGRIYVSSDYFRPELGLDHMQVIRLNPDGSLDSSFRPPAEDSHLVTDLAVDAYARLLVSITGNTFGGTVTGSLLRLLPDGSIDASFTAGFGSTVNDFALHPDQRIAAGGTFTSVNGLTRRNVARIAADGAADTAVGSDTHASSTVDAVAALPNGGILIAGSFTSVYGINRSRIARLNPDGGLDDTFVPPVINGTVRNIAAASGGKVLIAGDFTKADGSPCFRIARLGADGSVDDDFRTGMGCDNRVNTVSVLGDGSYLLGGSFTQYDLTPAAYLTRLAGEPAADPPTSPVLSISQPAAGGFLLSWNLITDASSYRVESSVNGMDGWEVVASLQAHSILCWQGGFAPGTSRFFRVRAMNGAGSSAHSNTVSATTWNGFEIWKTQSGFPYDAPAEDDADHDRMPLLLEYALDRDPRLADAAGAIETRQIGGSLVMSFLRARPDVTYRIETSPNLTGWTETGVSMSTGIIGMAWIPMSEPAAFLRLRAEMP